MPSLLMLKEKNYFEIFKLSPSFNINLKKLENDYYSLSKKYHPDICKSDINFKNILDAYSTLKNDFLRAKYLNKLNKKSQLTSKLSSEFLNEIFCIQERIENASKDEISQISKMLNDKIKECRDNYFDMEYLNKWKYYERLNNLIYKRMSTNE